MYLVCELWFICCFFFFKQKTAYEVRIRDWSSDVCSSDLLWRQIGEATGLARNAPADRPATFGDQALAVRKAAHGALAKVSDAIEELHFKIGRASCRERLCQSV